MVPIFDKHSKLCGWLKDNGNIFDKHMRWSAFIRNGNVFGARGTHWLGQFIEGSFNDRRGHPVA